MVEDVITMNNLVIAKYEEDIGWVKTDWNQIVYDKSKDVPNIGREAETYIRYIIEYWDKLPPITAFTQGNPFDHVPDYLETYKEIGYKGITHVCDWYGVPEHPGLDVKGYADLIGVEIPRWVEFKAGAIFTVTDKQIKQRPLNFYKNIDFTNKNAPWILERLWGYIFK